MEKEMVIHSSILACRIPQTEEPGRLLSMGSQRIRHDLVTKQDKAKKKKNSVYLRNFDSLPCKLRWLDYMNAAAAKSLQ